MSITSPISTPFGARSTAADVIAGIDLAGKRAVVTGGASGIGVETARALADAGADVTLAVRDTLAGERVAAQIGGAVDVAPLDLADLGSVRAFANQWSSGPLDLLVNNAGVMYLPRRLVTLEGWELHLATNHLGHFALAYWLHDALAASGAARIVSVSSGAHRFTPFDFDDPQFAVRPYDPKVAYGQSKTANVLFAVEATRRWEDDGITANAVHPGAIVATNLSRHMDLDELARLVASGRYTFKTIEQGAATSVLVATSPLLDGIGGRYFEDCNEAVVLEDDTMEPRAGVAAHALDPDGAERLWELSELSLRG
jgi:NAD(P)-dependent dehydrogenase (short-subunit alcohol dehydrogenase family)